MATTSTDKLQAAVSDPFFHLVPGGHFNACIGRQGSEENYMDGFIEAAQELASAVIDKRLLGKRDTLAMPILYNARHGLELALKSAIENLHRLERLGETHRANHDIRHQYGMLCDTNLGDELVRQTVANLGSYVRSLSAIDEDGQELRYAVNRDGKRSMETFALVDLELVKISLDDLAKLLSTLKYRIADLHEEKASGTWTRDCSRSDLMAIAKLMPKRVDWNTEAFDTAKADVMERFLLSGRAFSDAIHKIEASREGKRIIGVETPLTHLSDEHVMLVIELWRQTHPPIALPEGEEFNIVRARDIDWEAAEEDRRIAGEANARLMRELQPEEIADLESVFYIGREGWMPEFYEETLARTLRGHAVVRDLSMKLDRLMEKTNLAEELRKGVSRLGRPTLAKSIGDYLEQKGGQSG